MKQDKKNKFLNWLGELLVKIGFKKMGGKMIGLNSTWFLGEIEAPQRMKDAE